VPLPEKRSSGVFILSHGRANNVKTWTSLKKAGYSGRVWIILDNEDQEIEKYEKNFGSENVIVFDKKKIATTFDEADTTGDRRSVVYARNASWEIAKDLGLTHFLQLDDDYVGFFYKYRRGGFYVNTKVRQADRLFNIFWNWLDSGDISCVAMSQEGDHIGGAKGNFRKHFLKRKAMNSLFMRVDRPFSFVGRVNEDVNTYVVYGTRGNIFFTTMAATINQTQTQSSAGGMTDLYLQSGTYAKSFYTILMSPSSVKLHLMRPHGYRIHHRISWKNTIPKIINDRYEKK